LAVENSGF
jgi:hypothetical protein